MKKGSVLKRLLFVIILLISAGGILNAANVTIPNIALSVNPSENPKDVAATIQIILLLTVLTLAPAILMLMTSFTRIIIVLSFLRQALGSQQIPPNQILIGLALFMTFFLMRPVGTEIYDKAWKPYSENKITLDKAVDEAVKPVRQFMFKQTREKDLALFIYLSKSPRPKNPDDVPTSVLIPAFVISELKTAFTVGFIIYVPFLIIDMVVASTLMSMGMMMLPPVMISLPFKILLFILVDGWHLLSRALIVSF
ncbi:MAG: flagellar biosynthetic protein FliP [Candidatus Goldiibacteriota bacterium HGW-Goldbacteria-1]|jgi:flagellar biosynthetic protein FliP|nr:MAG: flagellar biosynthetic protein FliP [Candidatus Goldiibacteriota bacterium HGW-Goldbacteria-1]